MLRVVTAELDHPPSRVYPVLADLGSYAEWMPLVHRVEPADPAVASIDEAVPAWLVTLRARIGPLARAKRLRMVRTVAEAHEHVRFERAETDGRSHSAWIMDGTVAASDRSRRSSVRIELRYEGGLWSGALDALLGSSIDDAVDGLRRRVERG
jgi:hypothetical protein